MATKKILILTYYWPPAGGPGVQRWLKFTKYLPETGIEPIVLTVDPTTAEYPQQDESLMEDISSDLQVYRTKCRGVYDLYKKFTKSKSVPYGGFVNEANPTLKQKVARFVRGNFFLPDPRKGWNKFAFPEAEKFIRSGEINTIITTGPPHSTHLIGLKLKQKFKNIQWIADFRDPWTDIYYNKLLYQTFIARSINKTYEKQVVENCDHLIAVSPSLKELLKQKTNKDISSKITVIPNGYDEEDFAGLEGVRRNKQFTITYTGTMADSYPIDSFLEAIRQLSDHISIKIRFIGTISENLKIKIKSSINDIAEFTDPVPHRTSIEFLLQSSLLLLVIPDIAENKGILTGKLFEYIGSGTPIICIGPSDGDAAEIIHTCHSGEIFEPDDIINMRNYIERCYHNFIDQQVAFNKSNIYSFSRKALTHTLGKILESAK